MLLIIGLGNPGPQYENTPHNLGFQAVDEFRSTHNFPVWKKDKNAKALVTNGVLNQQEILVVKPQTFMNRSGESVKKIMARFKLKPENVWIVHDDADLPFGSLRISKGRGSAGHKGVESIINAIKSKNMVRFRMGTDIEIKPKKRDLASLVLKKFTPEEQKIANNLVRKTSKAISEAIIWGVSRAMAEYNKTNSPRTVRLGL